MKRSFAFLLLLFAYTFATAQTTDCAALTHQALELSGFNQSLDHLTDVLSGPEFMQQMRGSASAEEFIKVFQPLMQKEFDGALLRKEMEERVAARCNPEQMAQVVAKLQTPLVAKMVMLEEATNTPEGQAKLKKYIKIASVVPPTDDRVEDIDAIDASSGASDFATDMIMAIWRGLMTGFAAPSDLVSQLQDHRKDLKAQMQNSTELSMSVTYHGVTRPELQQYAKVLGVQPLKGFYARANKEFVGIVEERSQALGQDLKKALVAIQASHGRSL